MAHVCTISVEHVPCSDGQTDTLAAYIEKYTSLVPFLAPDARTTLGQPESDPAPEEQVSKAISLQKGVVRDGTPIFKKFGQVLEDVEAKYRLGDTVVAVFVGANPRVSAGGTP